MVEPETDALPQSAWRRASRCHVGECVELSERGGEVLMRDSAGTLLVLPAQMWRAFADAIRAGEFDDFG
jgi:hypothetical protein